MRAGGTVEVCHWLRECFRGNAHATAPLGMLSISGRTASRRGAPAIRRSPFPRPSTRQTPETPKALAEPVAPGARWLEFAISPELTDTVNFKAASHGVDLKLVLKPRIPYHLTITTIQDAATIDVDNTRGEWRPCCTRTTCGCGVRMFQCSVAPKPKLSEFAPQAQPLGRRLRETTGRGASSTLREPFDGLTLISKHFVRTTPIH